jgi:hypothetical protein
MPLQRLAIYGRLIYDRLPLDAIQHVNDQSEVLSDIDSKFDYGITKEFDRKLDWFQCPCRLLQ